MYSKQGENITKKDFIPIFLAAWKLVNVDVIQDSFRRYDNLLLHDILNIKI